MQFVRELIPDLLGDPTLQIGGLKGVRNSRANSLKAPSNSVPKNTVCAKFNDSLIRLVVAMRRYYMCVVFSVFDIFIVRD